MAMIRKIKGLKTTCKTCHKKVSLKPTKTLNGVTYGQAVCPQCGSVITCDCFGQHIRTNPLAGLIVKVELDLKDDNVKVNVDSKDLQQRVLRLARLIHKLTKQRRHI